MYLLAAAPQWTDLRGWELWLRHVWGRTKEQGGGAVGETWESAKGTAKK